MHSLRKFFGGSLYRKRRNRVLFNCRIAIRYVVKHFFRNDTMWYEDILREIEREIRRMEEIFRSIEHSTAKHRIIPSAWTTRGFTNYDIMDHGDEYEIVVELPGAEKDTINVDAWNSHIRITAEKHNGEVELSVKLPDKIDIDSVKASYKNGVLTVKAKKLEVGEKRTVNIE